MILGADLAKSELVLKMPIKGGSRRKSGAVGSRDYLDMIFFQNPYDGLYSPVIGHCKVSASDYGMEGGMAALFGKVIQNRIQSGMCATKQHHGTAVGFN